MAKKTPKPHVFTEIEDFYLKENCGGMNAEALAGKLSATVEEVSQRLQELGLKKVMAEKLNGTGVSGACQVTLQSSTAVDAMMKKRAEKLVKKGLPGTMV